MMSLALIMIFFIHVTLARMIRTNRASGSHTPIHYHTKQRLLPVYLQPSFALNPQSMIQVND